jgi:hypothetical protein
MAKKNAQLRICPKKKFKLLVTDKNQPNKHKQAAKSTHVQSKREADPCKINKTKL